MFGNTSLSLSPPRWFSIHNTECLRRRSGGCYMIVPFEAYCSWHLCQTQARHFQQHFSAETWFKLRLQIGTPSLGFLIINLIYPISWNRLPCKPHKVRISTLIKPSFSDDSRALKISGCYLRAAECHSRCSPPTVTLNTVIKWGWVLSSPSSHSRPWLGSSSVSAVAVKRLSLRWRHITRQRVIKFVLPLTHAGFVRGQHSNFRWKEDPPPSPLPCTWSCIYFSFKGVWKNTSPHLVPSPDLHIKISQNESQDEEKKERG